MSLKVTTWAWHDADAHVPVEERLKPVELVVLMALADIADDEGLCRFVSDEGRHQVVLAEKCRTSVRTLKRVVAELRERSLVDVERSSRTDANRYRVLVPWARGQDGPSREATGGPSEGPAVAPRSSLRRTDGVNPSRGSRIDPEWTPSDADRAFVTESGPSLDLSTEVASFRDYWLGVPGTKGVKLDWSATWRNHIRRQHGFNVQRGWQPIASSEEFEGEEWMLRG